MAKNEAVSDIFEEIRTAANCNYLSDLHSKEFAGSVVLAVSNIPEDKYTVDEWNSLISYITGQQLSLSSVRECRLFLYERLGR